MYLDAPSLISDQLDKSTVSSINFCAGCAGSAQDYAGSLSLTLLSTGVVNVSGDVTTGPWQPCR